jgi:cytochrome c oxidase subunit 3
MRSSKVADHFADLQTQHHSATLGMWVFLVSEMLLFAGLFALYGSYYAEYTHGFREAAAHNTLYWGSANTVVLITSSLTVALAVWAMREGRRRATLGLLVATIVLGLGFLAIKFWEYAIHAHEGLLPGHAFDSPELHGPGPVIFYSLYWFMTVLHAVHMTVGIALMASLTASVLRGHVTKDNHISLELGGMYWHLVDIVWIFLWPLLYLVR